MISIVLGRHRFREAEHSVRGDDRGHILTIEIALLSFYTLICSARRNSENAAARGVCMNGDRDRELIQSDETLFAIIDALKQSDGVGVSQVASAVGVSKSTAHRHLSTLLKHQYVVRTASGYRLGLRFLDLGGHVREQYPSFADVEPKVTELAETTGELAQFIAPEHGKGIFVFRRTGEKAVRTEARVGKRVFLHHTAAGKATLAAMSDETVSEIIDRWGLPAKTDATTTDRDALFSELNLIRDRGFAIDADEHLTGLWSVGCPVMATDDRVLGGISVAGPRHRMKDAGIESALPELLQAIASEIELNITYR